MKNYRLDYVYDGYKFWDVVAAETPEDAKEYFAYHKGVSAFKVEETTEEPTYTATAAELEEIRKPFWEKRGAKSEEELLAYTRYCRKIDEEIYAKFIEEHPDADPEDAFEDVDYPTVEEWRAMNK